MDAVHLLSWRRDGQPISSGGTAAADPIGRVAERAGFSSQSYFDRLFRARHGQTPRAYREQARGAVVPKEP